MSVRRRLDLTETDDRPVAVNDHCHLTEADARGGGGGQIIAARKEAAGQPIAVHHHVESADFVEGGGVVE